MSYENFDYDKALNSIKATLFDIYEAHRAYKAFWEN